MLIRTNTHRSAKLPLISRIAAARQSANPSLAASFTRPDRPGLWITLPPSGESNI